MNVSHKADLPNTTPTLDQRYTPTAPSTGATCHPSGLDACHPFFLHKSVDHGLGKTHSVSQWRQKKDTVMMIFTRREHSFSTSKAPKTKRHGESLGQEVCTEKERERETSHPSFMMLSPLLIVTNLGSASPSGCHRPCWRSRA